MRIETAIFVTTLAFLGARLLISGRKGLRNVMEQERVNAAELDELAELFRPTLLFTTTKTVAHC
jgi:hypothetical protein